MLTRGMLAAARAQVVARLGDTGTVYTYTRTEDGMGGGTATFTASGTVACSVAPSRHGTEKAVADAERTVGPWVIIVPHGTALEATDRFACNGHTFEVTWADAGQTDHAALVVSGVLVE